MMKRNALALLSSTILGLSLTGSYADVVIPPFVDYSGTLGGTTSDYQWSGTHFTSESKPAGIGASVGGSASQWVAGTDGGATNHGITSNDGSTSNRFFVPTSFSGTYSAAFGSDTVDFLSASSGGGIYSFFSQTHFEITSIDPVADLKTLTLQVYMAAGLSTSSGGAAVDMANGPSLILTTTSGTVTLGATYSLLESSVPTHIAAIGLDSTLDLLGYQWDLSSVSGSITGYAIDWQTSYHSIFYGADVTESDAVQPSNQLVPEPSTWALLGLSIGALVVFPFFRKRRMVE